MVPSMKGGLKSDYGDEVFPFLKCCFACQRKIEMFTTMHGLRECFVDKQVVCFATIRNYKHMQAARQKVHAVFCLFKVILSKYF